MTSKLSSSDATFLQQTPAIEMHRFNDAQFLAEPRLKMMQNAFHCLRQTTHAWAQQGLLGEYERQDSFQQYDPSMIAAMANATIQRPTLNAYQQARIVYAHERVQQFINTVKALGHGRAGEQTPDTPHQFCDLNGTTFKARVHLDHYGIWLFTRFEPLQDAHDPINRISTILVPGRPTGTTAILTILPLHTVQAQRRALEIMELARWALRQPLYSPAL